MTYSFFFPLLAYAVINSFTPGPNVLCSFHTSLNQETRRAFSLLGGIGVGFLLVGVLATLLTVFLNHIVEPAMTGLRFLGAGYLFWMAYQLMHPLKQSSAENRKAGFWMGCTLQICNGKLFLYIITALSSFIFPYTHSFMMMIGCLILLSFIEIIANVTWIIAGKFLYKVMQQYPRLWNRIMGGLLGLCAIQLMIG